MHLATSARSIYVFWIDGIPQLIVYLPHADKYILHSRQTSNDRNGKARWKWCIWSVRLAAMRRDVSVARKSKPANQNKKKTVFVQICSHFQDCDAAKFLRSVFGLATGAPDVSTTLRQASWSHREVVLRTGFNRHFTLRRKCIIYTDTCPKRVFVWVSLFFTTARKFDGSGCVLWYQHEHSRSKFNSTSLVRMQLHKDQQSAS